MAKSVESILIGIDVSKAELVIARNDTKQVETIKNTAAAIKRWLTSVPAGSRIALEATGVYHRLLTQLAHEAGHPLFLLDGYKLSHYRDGVGTRAKTDQADARLILRYLTRERDELKPWIPPHDAFYRIQSLMRRRAALVQTRVALNQSLRDIPQLKQVAKQLDQNIRRVEQLIVQRLKQALAEVGWYGDAQRCDAIEGIGELTSMALANTFHRGRFRSSDAFIAYLGMDVKVRDSGTQKGRRKLTKKGDPELRRLLYNAAMAARKTTAWKGLYNTYLAQGLKPTQALVKLARKLARIAFALMQHQTAYQPKTSG
ncbi:IS110 family RNA-guided transposase [Halopseudomonas xiamenensis]|uniref:IS110 family transposase n=1 Tax=Halopseudomonas xiamenensis TaxID=157792 RepID=UPI0016289310|nr:IS110 family transposase [Halopseudomonas xiamenensis]